MMNSAQKKALAQIMLAFSEEYTGRFVVSDTRTQIWCQILGEYPVEIIQAAGYHLLSYHTHPPTVGQMREQCAMMSHGQLYEDTASDAWQGALAVICGDSDYSTLSDMSKKALKSAGKLTDLKTSTNMSADRAAFVTAYNHLLKRQKQERVTLREVKAMVAKHAKLLKE